MAHNSNDLRRCDAAAAIEAEHGLTYGNTVHPHCSAGCHNQRVSRETVPHTGATTAAAAGIRYAARSSAGTADVPGIASYRGVFSPMSRTARALLRRHLLSPVGLRNRSLRNRMVIDIRPEMRKGTCSQILGSMLARVTIAISFLVSRAAMASPGNSCKSANDRSSPCSRSAERGGCPVKRRVIRTSRLPNMWRCI